MIVGHSLGIFLGASTAIYFLKHSTDHAHIKMHMLVQAGAEAVNTGDCANMQGGPLQKKATAVVLLPRC